jgi:hypothetical protein
MRTERDIRNQIAYAYEEGKAIGFVEVYERLFFEKRLMVVEYCQEQGFSEDTINCLLPLEEEKRLLRSRMIVALQQQGIGNDIIRSVFKISWEKPLLP